MIVIRQTEREAVPVERGRIRPDPRARALRVTAPKISHVAVNSPTGWQAFLAFFPQFPSACLQQLVAIDPDPDRRSRRYSCLFEGRSRLFSIDFPPDRGRYATYLGKGSRCAFTRNRGLISCVVCECTRRACVRPALGAHCSISAAGTATPPDWAIHHRRRRPAPLSTPRPAPAQSRPCATAPRSTFPCVADSFPPTR
ncbi:unnamed protein product [Euphydryas editha]|uniref:Uncharacterized protein n=1 Tax=Euphydryas editha TaxID=104508 RepID=A0AAU9UAT4_EUPED|nr:unnamed protein product [Euphydryas editha]